MERMDASCLSDSTETRKGSENPTAAGVKDWEAAQNRILLYLRALHIEPDQRLILAVQAYERARAKAKIEHEAVSEAMVLLWQILAERNIFQDPELDFRACNFQIWARQFPGYSLENLCPSMGTIAAPPINRRPMPPAALGFSRRRTPNRARLPEPNGKPLRSWFYLKVALLAILLIFFLGS